MPKKYSSSSTSCAMMTSRLKTTKSAPQPKLSIQPVGVASTRSSIASKMNEGSSSDLGSASEICKKPGRLMYIIRHGERIDFTFGTTWLKNAHKNGEYAPYDLNLPKTLPKRKCLESYNTDSPLTIQGHFQARQIGEALKAQEVKFDHVYSSPALRCVQTAAGILQGLEIDRDINIEPGIFEWLAWYPAGLPEFMTVDELKGAGFQIGSQYAPITTAFDPNEKLDAYYDRCHKATGKIVERHQGQGANILLVAHKGSVDVCTRQLVNKPKLKLNDFRQRLDKVPYCAVAACHQDADTGGWHLTEPGIPPFTHGANKALEYDWRVWLR